MSAANDLEKRFLSFAAIVFIIGLAVIILAYFAIQAGNKETEDCEKMGGIYVKTTRGFQCFDRSMLLNRRTDESNAARLDN